MNHHGDNMYSRIHTLTVRQLDGELTDAEHAELQTMLLDNAAARKAYVHYFQDTACLRWLCLEELPGDGDSLKSLPSEPLRGRRRFVSYVFYGGVASLIAAVAFSLFNSRLTPPASIDQPAVAVLDAGKDPTPGHKEPVDDTPAQPHAEQVATITGLGAVQWAHANGNQIRLLGRCAVGDCLELTDGAIELTFDAGAQVTVFAPADFTIMSSTSIECKRGRVTTLVGERGKGFIVLTPQAKVVDLGTQFGLSVSDSGETEVVVFQGSVNMSSAGTENAPVRRLSQGDALVLKKSGQFERVVSIQRNDFLRAVESFRQQPSEPVIADVHDNIRTEEGVKSYQIVRNGFDEDALCFVDRNHQWNGIDKTGLPKFLLGADYIMPFNDDKFCTTLELKVRLLRPASLYVFLDNNMEVPAWVRKDFKDTGIDIGLDGGQTEWHQHNSLDIGAGRSVDFPFSVWRRDIKEAGTVTLGPVNPPKVGTRSYGFNMYGIAAVAAE